MDADDLYGLALDQFVSERASLARALRTQGLREQAATIAGLRKPSVAAWAVNQLVRTQRRSMAGLFAAGDALRKAQEDVLAGRGDGRALRAAAERERAAADALVTAARGLLSSNGHQLSPAVIDRVAETLRAASIDDYAREALRGGRLERELRHVGLGVPADIASAPQVARPSEPAKQAADDEPDVGKPARPGAGQPGPRAKPASAEQPQPTPRERAAAERAERKRDEALKAASDAESESRRRADRAARAAESESRRRADRAARAVVLAEQRRERAAQALRDADRALIEARAEADRAVDAHRRAQDKLPDR